MQGKGRKALLKFRTEDGCDCSFAFVCFEKGERVRASKAEKDFEDMLNDEIEYENLRFDPKYSAYVISGEQEQFLRGAAVGYCFAVNRRLSSGYCFAQLHTC